MTSMNRLCLSLATLSLLSGCATTGGATGTAVIPSELKGTWTSAVCESMPNADGSKTYFKRIFDMTETNWALKFETFGDEGCTARLFTARFEGPYTLLKDSDKVAGATEGNFVFAKHYMTAHAQGVADWFQSAKCGAAQWKVGEEQETSTTGCVFLRPVSACGTDHDIVKVEGNQLFFGQRPADGDMCSPDKRPTALTPVAVVRS
jgi:uncharacterized protein YceK